MGKKEQLRILAEEVAACRLCPRLVKHRERMAREKRRAFREWEYWGRPVPGYGDPHAELLIVGLAPAAHGANRTGRMFTGDRSGDFLYAMLHRAGFANQSASVDRGDGLILRNAYVTAAARCAPPENKPLPRELANCRPYLERELDLLRPRVVLALGRIAFDALVKLLKDQGRIPARAGFRFAHGASYALPAGSRLFAAYHPSQQNTFTGRVTPAMFMKVLERIRRFLKNAARSR